MSNATYAAECTAINTIKSELYICETCGKHVYEYYGSGRFCCAICARKYSSAFGNNEKSRKKKSETLKKRHLKKPKKYTPRKNKPHKRKVAKTTISKHQIMLFSLSTRLHSFNCNTLHIELPLSIQYDIIKGGIFILTEMLKKWTLFDISALLNIKETGTLYSYANSFNLVDDPKFIPCRQYNRIKICRNALNKQLIDGSITFNDQNVVARQCEHLIYTENWSSSKICIEYLKLDKYSVHTLQAIGVATKNLSEAVSLYCSQNKPKALEDEYKKYTKQC